MSAGGPTRAEVPPDTRPAALILGGLRRGGLLVFLPVFLAGQGLAWLTYAASGWYHPWSWFKIGLAQTLASVRVAFITGGTPPATLQVAYGALTIAVLVLAFRAGREQARGLERRPARAAAAGAAVGPGLAIPMLLAAFPVTLGFPQFGISHLHAVLWQTFVLPLVVAGIAGAVGGLASVGDRLAEGGAWSARAVAAARGGASAFWWAVVLAFLGFLVVAVLSPGPTGAYARFVSRTGGSGAATLIEHAVLLPDQSVLVLTTAMGATTSLEVGGASAVELTRSGVSAVSAAGEFLAAYVGANGDRATFPSWFALFLLVPLAGTLVGGRRAGTGEPRWGERALRGALAGVVYACLCVIAAWAATLVVPAWAGLVGGSVRLGPALGVTGALAGAWGVGGCVLGAAVLARARPAATEPR